MQREEHVPVFGIPYLLTKELDQCALAHESGVKHFTGHERKRLFQHRYRAVCLDVLDLRSRCRLKSYGLLVVLEIIGVHGRHVRPGILWPGTHARRVCPGKVLHRLWRAPVGVALPQYGVHRASHRAVVTGLYLPLLIAARGVRVIRKPMPLGLQFRYARLHLRN